jgi:hypothetical protein
MNNYTTQKGNVLILTTVFFVAISLSVCLGLAIPAIRAHKVAEHTLHSKRSYYLSQSGVDDVFYRLKAGMDVQSSQTLVLDEMQAITTLSDISSTQKEIISIGESSNRERKIRAVIMQGQGVSFNYGVQTGQGGLMLSGSSGINGSVYANGSITGTGSPFITGAAIAANATPLDIHIENGTSGTPSQSIVFGNNNATQDIAQKFIVDTALPLNKVQFYIRKQGSPSNATVTIRSGGATDPSSTIVATGTLSSSLVTTSFSLVDVVFGTSPLLQTGVQYWLVVDAGTNASNYYIIAANDNGYIGGNARIGRLGNSWSDPSPSSLDIGFNLLLGGLSSVISGDSQWNRLQVGTSGTGLAHAEIVNNTSTPSQLYCKSGTGNNKSCDTVPPIPSPQPWPISQGNIDSWKAEALAGGTTVGNINAGSGWQTVTLGPRKIEGNLSVGGSATLNVTGTLWVTGDLTINGAGKMQLANTYGGLSGVVIVDGKVSIGGSSPVTGSGAPGSFIMIVSNSNCPTGPSCGGSNAISVSGAAGAVVLVAQNGTLSFSGSGSAKQATAYRITLSGNTRVNYDSGLANMSFASGPSGTWNVEKIKEIE